MWKYLAATITAAFLGVLCSVALANGGGGGKPEFVTICHAAGQEGTTKFVTLTLPYNAVYGQAGHLNENGTTQAGHEQDYLGPCEGDETTPTETTPTETTPTETTPTETTPTTSPPHVVVGTADVYCDFPSATYIFSGKIDGQAADKVTPATLPGSTKGYVTVTVTRGDTSHRVELYLYGDCGTRTTTTTTTPGTTTTPTTTPPASTPPASTPPKTSSTSTSKPPKLTGDPKKDRCKEENGLFECQPGGPGTPKITVIPGQG